MDINSEAFTNDVYSEIRYHWINELRHEIGSNVIPNYKDPGLELIVSDFLNSFCLMNGAPASGSKKEALKTIILNTEKNFNLAFVNHCFNQELLAECIVYRSFDKKITPFIDKYVSTLKIPDTCKHSSWRDFDSIYDENDNLKPEFRTQVEIEMDDQYEVAGKHPPQRNKRTRSEDETNPSKSDIWKMPSDLATNPVETTAEEVFGIKSSGMSKEEKRQQWWDNLIGHRIRKRVCYF